MARRVTLRDLPAWRPLNDGTGRRELDVPPPVACPVCAAPLDLATRVTTGTDAAPRIARRVAFCSGCEFVHEF